MSTDKKPKLTECKSLQEAIQVLNVRRAPRIYTKYVETAFNIKDGMGQGITPQMLQEAENNLQKEEDEKALSEMHREEEKKKNGEMGHQMTESVQTEPGPNKDGDSAQSDGRTLDDVKPPAATAPASEPMQTQSGDSQLGEAIEQVADQGNADPMNACVIAKMGQGMSEVEAQNACAKEGSMAEAIFQSNFKKYAIPMFEAANKDLRVINEAIKIQEKKIEVKPELKGLQESVNMTNISATPTTKPESNEKFNRLKDPHELAIYRKSIQQKYYPQ